MDTTRKKKGLEWYHWSILVTGIIYTLMNTTFVIINAYTCINWDPESATILYNISYNSTRLDKSCLQFENLTTPDSTVDPFYKLEGQHHIAWGCLSICFVTLPGLFLITQTDGPIRDGLKLWTKTFGTRNLKYCTKFFGYMIVLICFPIALFSTQLIAMLTNDVDWFKVVMLMVGLEAFFHSLPQFLLQLFMIVNGYPLTITQLALLLISFTLVLSNCLRFDIIVNRTRFKSIKDIIIFGIRVLPQHVTGIWFRSCTLVLTLTFLRYKLCMLRKQ